MRQQVRMELNKTFASLRVYPGREDFFQSMTGPFIAIFRLWRSPLLLNQTASTHLPVVTARQLDSIWPCTYGYTAGLATLSSYPDYVVKTCKYHEIRQRSSRNLQPGGPKGGWFIDTLPSTYLVQGMSP